MVMPTTSWPCSTSSAAATEESTPPLMPTTMRSLIDLPVRASFRALFGPFVCSSVPRAEQLGETLGLDRRRARDRDLPPALVADDAHARHQSALERFLERRQLHRAPPTLLRRQ